MKLLVVFLIAANGLAGQAQEFDCGKGRTGAMTLTARSFYSASTPGFDMNTVPEVSEKSCSSDKPFFFSVAMPEGSYRVTVVLGTEQASKTTVWAEARRLMLDEVQIKPNGSIARSFDTNVRVPEIRGDTAGVVKLKPREVGTWTGIPN